MIDDPFAGVPLDASCALSVVIPAQNEADHVVATLAALVDQRDATGAPLAPASFDVLVFANNCSDATADVVRAFAAAHPAHAIHVAEASFPPTVAHIGTARRTAMSAAAARFERAGREGILAATDADTVVAPRWIDATLDEMRHADAVLGRILVDRGHEASLPEHTRRMLREENTYQFHVAHLESAIDPAFYGAWPRHWQRSGPSFAVRVSAYERAGGVPPVRVLEDIALYRALVRCGTRMRHSLRVRVTTSARVVPRADGGFGTRVAEWNATGASGAPLLVERPDLTLARVLRRDDRVATDPRDLVPVAEATAALRQMIGSGAIAARATRKSVASMAG
jgi:cellulose synthase/poly-beta-1,6-N-acetylglucosamine synthase-like glycosyltransferase